MNARLKRIVERILLNLIGNSKTVRNFGDTIMYIIKNIEFTDEEMKKLHNIILNCYETFLVGVETDLKNTVRYPDFGICNNVSYVLFDSFLYSGVSDIFSATENLALLFSYDLVSKLSVDWEHPLKQSDLSYPIKRPNDSKRFNGLENLWEAEQLEARISLLKHIIKHLKTFSLSELLDIYNL